MPVTDLLTVLQWWGMLFILGLISLPLTVTLFPSFFDRGYIFAKILGLLAISYISWLLSSLKIAPFETTTLLAIGIGFTTFNLFLLLKNRLGRTLHPNLKFFLLEELIFTLGLIFWAYIRAHEPSIHGLEKFMDFGFINSIIRTNFFPPQDIWMSSLPINYYYFGHLTGAVLTKLSWLDPAIAYNLILATIFGLTFTASFSLGANLYRFFLSSSKLYARRYTLYAILSGLLTAFLVTLAGNLHTIYAFFQSYSPDNPVPFWQLPFTLNFSGYWYPSATRFIPFTIHEFPLYSFVVADLHGHVLNIPFVLLLIAVLMAIFFSPKLDAKRLTLTALLISVFLMTNILDAPIYLLVIFLVLLLRKRKIFNALYITLLIAISAIVFSLPFWLSFKPFGSGVGVLCAPEFLINLGKIGPLLFEADHCARSPLWMLFILWGFFYLVVFVFIFRILNIKKLFKNLKLKIENSTDILVITLSIAATILIIIPELFYVKDIYPAHYRANTVFKFSYQAFIILALASGYMLTRLFTLSKKPFLFLVPCILLLFLVAIYPFFAVSSYYGSLKTYKGLNGIVYLKDLYPSDYEAILWLRDNISGQPVILEGQGDSYTDFARVSSNTGLPAVIGWPVHEWLWRGSYDESGKRITDVTNLYESQDLDLTRELIKKYNISYVFIGDLEREKYQKLDEEKFNTLGKVIFQSGQTKVYQLNNPI